MPTPVTPFTVIQCMSGKMAMGEWKPKENKELIKNFDKEVEFTKDARN